MNPTTPDAADPRLLLEASRVFNAAGPDYRALAEIINGSALEARDKADPDVRRAILGDAVALRLSGRVPGGYQQALDLLKDIGDDPKKDDPDGRLHLLRALARGQMYREERKAGKSADSLAALRVEIRKDLAFAFTQNNELRYDNRRFWQAAPAAATATETADDLRQVWEEDAEFRALVALSDETTTAAPVAPPIPTAPRDPAA
jgi:hypothetical protein